MRTTLFLLFVCTAFAQRKQEKPMMRQPPHYDEVYYQSGKLRIEAYLFKPQGNGPFPVVIYNHGSRAGKERISEPYPFIGRMMTEAGYVVLVPERRGYGQSQGPIAAEEMGNDRGARFVARMQEETGDVLAALDYLKTLPFADRKRVAIMGWSLGGIVSVFAAARSDAFAGLIDQAGASLTWDASPAMQKAMRDAAAKIRIPALAMVARNDKTTKAVEAVAQEMKSRGAPVHLIVYPEYAPLGAPRGIPPGHLLFTATGAKLWREDVLAFLAHIFTLK